jgi:mono/diheme cytochrome c family protein
MTLAFAACSDKQDKPPSSLSAATVFKDDPSSLQPPQGTLPADGEPGGKATPSDKDRTPEQLFDTLGCRVCHGAGGLFAASLPNARGKPAETVAMWILDAQKVKPGTPMPSFVDRITTKEALALAHWIKAGNPVLSDNSK